MVEVGRITAVIDGDISALKSKMAQGEAAAIQSARNIESKPIKIRSEVEKTNFSSFFSACDQAEKKSIIKIKTEVDNTSISGGLSRFMSSEKGKFSNVGKELGQSLTQGLEQHFGAMGSMASSVAGALGPAGIIAGAAIAGGAVIAAAAVNAARAWETLMSGVGKTAGLDKGTAEFNALSESLLQLSKTAGMGTQESLATIAQKAGSQGIGARAADTGNYALQRQQILAYTKDVQGMATAFDMTAEDSATMGAAVQKSFKLPMDEIHHMGSMVTTVGDSIGVEEKNILEFLSRAGGSKVATNEGVTKTAAFGAALMSTGMQAEVAASSITMLESQVLSNDKKMTTWAQTLGVTKDQLWQMTKTDFYGTVLKTGDLMSKMDISKSIPLGTEIFGAEVAKYINKMGGVGEDYYLGVTKGNVAMEEGTRLAEIFGEKGATVDSKWQAFSNTMNTAFVHLGTTALPVIGDIIDAMSGIVSTADSFGPAFGKAFDILSKGVLPIASLAKALGVGSEGGFSAKLSEATGGLMGLTVEQQAKVKAAQDAEYATNVPATTSGANWAYNSTIEGSLNTAGNMAGTVYGDALGNALKTKIPKAVSDGYLALGGLGGSKAAAEAGKATAEDFVKAQEDYIKSHSSGSYSSALMQNMAAQQTNDAGAKYLYSAQLSQLAKTQYAGLQNYAVIQSKIKTDTGGWLQIIDEAGNKIRSIRYLGDDQKEELKRGLIEAIEPAFMDLPKYMRGVKSEVSGALASILSDGVVEFTEKNQLMEYVKSLDAFQNKFPVEFEAQGLTKIRDDLVKTAAGIPLTLDLGKVEANFALWLTDKKDLWEKIFATTKQVPLEEEQRPRQQWELANQDTDALKWLNLMTAAATSGDPGAISATWDYKVALETLSPELINQKWYYQLLQTLQTEFGSQVRISNGNLVIFDEKGKTLGGTFLITANAANVLGPAFLTVASAATSAAASFNSAAGSLSSAAHQWVQSRVSDQSHYSSVANISSILPTSSVGMTGFNAAKPTSFSGFSFTLSDDTKLGMKGFARGGIADRPTMALFGEAGREAFVPLSDRAAGLRILPSVLRELGISSFAQGGLTMSDSLASWGGHPGASSAGTTNTGRDPNAAQWTDCVTGACRLQKETTQQNVADWNEGIDTSVTKTLQTFDAISTKQLQTSANWISSSSGLVTAANKLGTIDINRLGYNQDKEEFYYKAPAGLTKDIQMGRTSKETYAAYKSEYDAATKEIARMNEELDKAKENYLDCWDVSSDYSRWLWQPAQQATLFQGDFVGASSAYGAWSATGKKGNVGYSGNAAVLGGFQANEAGRMFRENGDPSGIIAASAFGSTVADPIVSAVGESSKSISGSITDGIVDWGDKIDILADGIFETNDILDTFSVAAKAGAGSIPGALIGGGGATKNTPWYLTEFDQYIASAESGLNSCIQSLSDFAIMQEGVMASDLFYPEYIGATDRTGPNYLDTFPTSGPYMAEAIRRGMPGTTTTEVSGAGADMYSFDQNGIPILEKNADSSKTTAANTKDLLSTANNILATSKDANLIAMASAVIRTAGGGSSDGGSNLIGGGGGGSGDWFSAASSRYGSTFNDWISGGAAGVGLFANEPAWFTKALNSALKSGVVGNTGNTGGTTARQVESTGGSYGVWVPAFANEGYVASPTLAVVGDRPDGEYVVGAARFEEAVARMGGGGVNITIHQGPITIQGGGSDVAAIVNEILTTRNREFVDEINDKIATGRRGL